MDGWETERRSAWYGGRRGTSLEKIKDDWVAGRGGSGRKDTEGCYRGRVSGRRER
jgi:hypothetical protein